MANQGLTITQAALKLGISTRTVRRYIKAGRIKANMVEGPFGEEYRIYQLPEKKDTVLREETIDRTSGQSAGRQSQDSTSLLDYIKELQDKNLALAAQLGAAGERVKNLEDQVKLLGAGKKPWWQRLFARGK